MAGKKQVRVPGNNLSEVRHLLFGDHEKKTESKLDSLSARLDREIASVKLAAEKRHRKEKQELKKEIAALYEYIEEISEEQATKHGQLIQLIQDVSKKKTKEISKRIATQQKHLDDLRKKTSSRFQTEKKRISGALEELWHSMGQVETSLDKKVNKSQIAKLYAGMCKELQK